MEIKCCKCKKEYDLANNIFEYKKDTNCPILICPYCGFKHVINFMPFEKRIKVKKIKKLDLAFTIVILGASRIANASRVDQSNIDDGNVETGTAWEVSTFVYANILFNPSGQVLDLTFNGDGTKMYCVFSDDYVRQYTLSTDWKVSTAIYSGKSKYVGDEESLPHSIAFGNNGTRMYVAGNNTDNVWQYNLSTAWDVSTAVYSRTYSIDPGVDLYVLGAKFNSTGTKMYIEGNEKNCIYEYSLSVPWEVNYASYTDSFDVSGQTTSPYGLCFSADGTKMYVVGNDTDGVFQYTLSTAWNIATASYVGKKKIVTAEETSPYCVAFGSDGEIMYVTGISTNRILQYELMGPWNKNNDFILAVRIYTSKGPLARAYKLRWRNVTDSGTFADVGATGEITYSATTGLTDEDDLLLTEKLCDVQSEYTWQNGKENEGDNILPNSGTYSLADEYYTELQWALNCNGALDEHKYEFELWDITDGISIGTCLASITMGITPSGCKWNTKTILKWCTKVISKWNGL